MFLQDLVIRLMVLTQVDIQVQHQLTPVVIYYLPMTQVQALLGQQQQHCLAHSVTNAERQAAPKAIAGLVLETAPVT